MRAAVEQVDDPLDEAGACADRRRQRRQRQEAAERRGGVDRGRRSTARRLDLEDSSTRAAATFIACFPAVLGAVAVEVGPSAGRTAIGGELAREGRSRAWQNSRGRADSG